MSKEDSIPEDHTGSARPATSKPAPDEGYRKVSLAALVMLATVGLGLHVRWLLTAKSFADAARQTSGVLDDVSGRLSAYALILGPFLGLLIVVTGLLVRHGLPHVWESVRRSALLGLLLGVCIFAAALLTSGKLRGLTELHWLFFVPVIPPVLLGYQALVVWRQRPRSLGRFSLAVSATTHQALERDGALERFELTYRQLVKVFGGPRGVRLDSAPGLAAPSRRAYSSASPGANGDGAAYHPAYFVTHFAVPSLLLLLVGFGAISVALVPPTWANEFAQRGLRWGVAGAFVYVLIEFGGRSFRNDLTVGAATWAIVTLLVGPALAVLLSVAWRMDPGPSPWQSGAVLFFAGLAPRRVVTVVEGVALQFLKTSSETAAPTQVVPLTRLRGITPEIAVRLREENIADVNALAYADAIRLVQNLPYDLRQVVDWIDQAQLVLALPKHHDTLRENGVTGAIDLAWRWLRASVTVTADGAVLESSSAPPASFLALLNRVEEDALVVYDTAAQLFYEEQVCLLWVMYNCFSTTAGEVDLEVERPPLEGSEGSRPRDPSGVSSPRIKAAARPLTSDVSG